MGSVDWLRSRNHRNTRPAEAAPCFAHEGRKPLLKPGRVVVRNPQAVTPHANSARPPANAGVRIVSGNTGNDGWRDHSSFPRRAFEKVPQKMRIIENNIVVAHHHPLGMLVVYQVQLQSRVGTAEITYILWKSRNFNIAEFRTCQPNSGD